MTCVRADDRQFNSWV